MFTMKLCHLCKQHLAVRLCEECNRYFCLKCMNEHRQKFQENLNTVGGVVGNLISELHQMHGTESCNEVKLQSAKEHLHCWQKDLEHLHNENGATGSLGVPFVDLSDKNGYKQVKWSRDAPEWRKARPGMCLEGFCRNEKCAAYGERVIISIGMGKFDLLTDPDSSTTPCPMCKEYVEPTTCAFNNCMWRWQGKKQVPGEPPMAVSGDWKWVGDAYHYFDQTIKGTATTSGTCIWRALEIEARDFSRK